MIACEYFFKEFYSRGSNDYLNAWAAQVDCMAGKGWQVLDCRRKPQPGFWTVIFERPDSKAIHHELTSDLTQDYDE